MEAYGMIMRFSICQDRLNLPKSKLYCPKWSNNAHYHILLPICHTLKDHLRLSFQFKTLWLIFKKAFTINNRISNITNRLVINYESFLDEAKFNDSGKDSIGDSDEDVVEVINVDNEQKLLNAISAFWRPPVAELENTDTTQAHRKASIQHSNHSGCSSKCCSGHSDNG